MTADSTATRRILGSLAFALLLGACQSSKDEKEVPPPPPQVFSAADDIVTYEEAQFGLLGCELMAGSSDRVTARIATGIEGTCHFARLADESLQVHVDDTGTYALVVASTPRDSDDLCNTIIRAIRLDADNLSVSTNEQRVLSCSLGPYDEQMIVTLSDSVPAGRP